MPTCNLRRSKWWNKVEMALMLETDPSEILNELISGVRKGGKISVVGVYSGYANHYNIGAFMVHRFPALLLR
jgi:threonine dehydrogenase-like Zn-dependent dehydrogenase